MLVRAHDLCAHESCNDSVIVIEGKARHRRTREVTQCSYAWLIAPPITRNGAATRCDRYYRRYLAARARNYNGLFLIF